MEESQRLTQVIYNDLKDKLKISEPLQHSNVLIFQYGRDAVSKVKFEQIGAMTHNSNFTQIEVADDHFILRVGIEDEIEPIEKELL